MPPLRAITIVTLVLALSSRPAAAQAGTTLHMVITGGPRPGTYDQSTTTACRVALPDSGTFMVEFGNAPGAINGVSTSPDSTKIYHVALRGPDAAEARTGTGRFTLSVQMGIPVPPADPMQAARPWRLIPVPGWSELTIHDMGGVVATEFSGVTRDSISFTGEIKCDALKRAPM